MPCFECNTDYYGYDIAKHEDYSVKSIHECQSRCHELPTCFYFTYVPQWSGCYLKTSDAGRISNLQLTLGFVSGPKNCGADTTHGEREAPYHAPECVSCNTDFYGWDTERIELRPTSSDSARNSASEELVSMYYDDDLDLCEDDKVYERSFGSPGIGMSASNAAEDCDRFNFMWNERSRNYHDLVANHENQRLHRDYAVRPIQNHTPIPVTAKNNFAKYLSRKSNDQYSYPRPDELLTCIEKCRNHILCNRITYSPIYGLCLLKGGSQWDPADAKVDYSTTGLISTTISCSSGKPSPPASCVEFDTDYFGNDIVNYHHIKGLGECLELCRKLPSCRYITYITNTYQCSTKYKADLVIKNQYTIGYISTSPYCSEFDTPAPSTTTTTTSATESATFITTTPQPPSTSKSIPGGDCVDGAYRMVEFYSGWQLFEDFEFFTADDPTQGYVNYVSKHEAISKGYVSVTNDGRAIITTDSTNKTENGSRGRDSVRIVSRETFSNGLWVFSLNHMPTGCGAWPAYWLVGDDPWPAGGEVDIMEGANKQVHNHMALHTVAGCHMHGIDESIYDASWSPDGEEGFAKDCYHGATAYNLGCAVDGTELSFGEALNSQGGAIIVTEVDRQQHIRVWYFNRNEVPADLEDNSNGSKIYPNPDTWTKRPMMVFPLEGNCNGGYFFKNLRIVINTTFCGGWAGYKFLHNLGCPGNGLHDCIDFVRDKPSEFKESYWDINYIKIFQKHTYDDVNDVCRVAQEKDIRFSKDHTIPVPSENLHKSNQFTYMYKKYGKTDVERFVVEKSNECGIRRNEVAELDTGNEGEFNNVGVYDA